MFASASACRAVRRAIKAIQGPSGEVTNAALANSSANTNAVVTLDIPFTNDPPTLADIERVRAKINELINDLQR